VEVEGGGNALDVRWEGNAFDDYAGYDMNGDGQGDIPYELRRLSSQLRGTYPTLQFFRGTVALEFLDAVSSLFPLVQPRLTLVDPHPAMRPQSWETYRAR
jgi:nitrous oxidase accessory protein